ncbi:OmpA family protein [Aurantibacter sp.]|uniref:OmpA family protein n=1 Tax=Flavobacteriaceae TaxID=49546 RepID=UPI0035C83161
MKNRIVTFALSSVLLTACVSPKVYKDLENKYADLKKENSNLADENAALLKTKNATSNDFIKLKSEYDQAVDTKNKLVADLAAARTNYKTLKESYDALEKNSSSALSENTKKNKELLAQLEAKETALASESARLETLKAELESRSKRVAELESVIAAKDASMTELKNSISSALTDFEGKGLTVEQRDGKVYVSMENKLLFKPGSWSVGQDGAKAVMQLGEVLAENPEISVLIEGHTDNDPFKGSNQISGNWDLSTKRATAIVNILEENKAIKRDNLTAAGRGEFAPIATNETLEGKAKNRRIEVILTPKLDQLSRLLEKR